jgi:endonuclease YncB( thermonuclease family)
MIQQRYRRNGRRKRRAWGFIAVVAAVMVIAFSLAFYWPGAGTSGPPGRTLASIGEGENPPPSRGSLSCAVAYINDGDTLRCRDGTRIRLHAVAAREHDGSCSPGHPCPSASAAAATAELRRLASGLTITCHPTGRSYNRVTAICWTPSGEEINCSMIRSGAAALWDRFNREEPLCRL